MLDRTKRPGAARWPQPRPRGMPRQRPAEALAAAAAGTVERAMPGLSARDGLARWQAVALICLVVAMLTGALLAPRFTLVATMIVSSVFFLGVSVLRVVAIAASPPPRRPERPPSDSALPPYTVLVPLYREANMVVPLIAALDRLHYPAEKLDIRLITEADDRETLAALAALRLPPRYAVLCVPDALPKTKPKALNFALAGASGHVVTIFDAEDWPEPGQLLAAASVFARAPADVACLQARLAWYNWTDNWITRQFALEYGALFDVLLPGLDRLGLPLPLGGTSNHFRGIR